jgi:hypothetical protein
VLVSVNLGTAALSLEEQLSRGVASLSGLVSEGAQAEAELLEILLTEEVWQKKLSYAEMNPTTTEVELTAIRQQVERIVGAREELEERIQVERAAKAQADADEEDEEEPVPELTDLEKAEQKAETAQELANRLQEQLAEAVSASKPAYILYPFAPALLTGPLLTSGAAWLACVTVVRAECGAREITRSSVSRQSPAASTRSKHEQRCKCMPIARSDLPTA